MKSKKKEITFCEIMKLNKEEIQKMGKLEEIVGILEREIFPLKIEVKNSTELYEVVKKLNKNWKMKKEEKDFFVSESAKYIFALNNMEGEKRNEIIGLTDKVYDSLKEAKDWRNKLVQKIHPDKNQDNIEEREKAFTKLQEIYTRIEKIFKEEKEEK